MIDKQQNIILIGFMGSGKTTLAKLLAAKLGLVRREVDEEVLAISGYSSIRELFHEKGEVFFRQMETKVLEDALKKTHQVISPGGGAPVRNGELLMKSGTIIYLKCSLKVIKNRLQEDFSRPLLSKVKSVEDLYLERSVIYEKLADFTIDAEVRIEEVLELALSCVKLQRENLQEVF